MSQNSQPDTEKKFYHPWAEKPADADVPERFPLNPTSPKYQRGVCLIQALSIGLSDQARARYADQAGLEPSEYIEVEREDNETGVKGIRKVPVFELNDVYRDYHKKAALAQALFAGFPTIIELVKIEEDPGVEIVNRQLFDLLDSDVVDQAFLDFSGQRGGILQKLLGSLNT